MNCVVPVSYERSLLDHYAAVRARLRNVRPPPPRVEARVYRTSRVPMSAAEAQGYYNGYLHSLAKSVERLDSRGSGISLGRLMVEIAEKHGVTVAEICSDRRSAYIVAARHEYFYRARTETTKSFPQIALACGGRDHSTVIAGVRKHEARMRGKAA